MTAFVQAAAVIATTSLSRMLPRFLYIGHVSVEAGLYRSALLYRLRCEDPPERSLIVDVRGTCADWLLPSEDP